MEKEKNLKSHLFYIHDLVMFDINLDICVSRFKLNFVTYIYIVYCVFNHSKAF